MKHLHSILILLFLSTSVLCAQNLYIQFYSGSSAIYGLNTVDRITFSATDMQLHLSGSSIQSYGMDSISFYNYQPIISSLATAHTTTALEVKLFPNPSSGTVQLYFDLTEAAELQLLLHNIAGQTLLSNNKLAPKGVQQWSLDLKGLGIEAGLYFIELRCNKQRFINKIRLQ